MSRFTDVFARDDETVPLMIADNLRPYKNHPFKLYAGERLDEMVESIKANGIINPLIIRPLNEETKEGSPLYEILSGHNRLNAAKLAGMLDVPCIIRQLSDEDAEILVTETNLHQRSFADLSHSERAFSLKHHLEALKNKSGQGRRNDLISLLETQGISDNSAENSTSGQIVPKLRTRESTGEQFGLNPRMVSRYIRLTQLNKGLLEMVDEDEIGVIPAVAVSYLSSDEQTDLQNFVANGYKLDLKKAEQLKYEHDRKNRPLNREEIQAILEGELKEKKLQKETAFKLPRATVTRFFDDDTPKNKITETIEKALELYFEALENDQLTDGQIV